jgi:DNA recombination protein RmuC
MPTDFFYGCGAAALLALAIGWFILRQQRELIQSRVSAELQAAHAIELRAEAERRAAAEMQNTRLPELEELLRYLQQENSQLQARQADLDARLETERASHATQLNLLENARAELSDAFKALSADALRNNNQSFLELANTSLKTFQERAGADLDRRQQAIDALVKPMRESLDKVDGKINELELKRAGAYESLTAQVHSLIETQHVLRGETSNLVNALRSPNVRGRWGEIQLRRVVELAGMLNYCDFTEQTSVQTADGRLRPDLIVRLPAGKTIVVDSKAPIEAYFEAARSVDDAERLGHLRRHAGHIRGHIDSLTRKAYWDQFPATPEFVVLFLPGENFFSAALEHDPALIEHGVDRKIILATPTTLIALLRAVFHGWRQEALSRDAVIISELGRDLYRRLSKLGEHFAKLGGSLDNATKAYNEAVGSLETRVLVTARKFRELEAMSNEAEAPLLEPVERAARVLQTEELQPQLPLPPPSA